MAILSMLAVFTVPNMNDSILYFRLRNFSNDVRAQVYAWHALAVRLNKPLLLKKGLSSDLFCRQFSDSSLDKNTFLGVLPDLDLDGVSDLETGNLPGDYCASFSFIEEYSHTKYAGYNFVALPKDDTIVFDPSGKVRIMDKDNQIRDFKYESGDEEDIGIAVYYPATKNDAGDSLGIPKNIYCLRFYSSGEISIDEKSSSSAIASASSYSDLCSNN